MDRFIEYRDPFVCYCFGGGGGGSSYTPPPPTPPTNTPAEPGSDAFQRFQEIRAGFLTGQGATQLIQPPTDVVLGTTKGTSVTGRA